MRTSRSPRRPWAPRARLSSSGVAALPRRLRCQQAPVVGASARVAAAECLVVVGVRVPRLQVRDGITGRDVARGEGQGSLEALAVERLVPLEIEALRAILERL